MLQIVLKHRLTMRCSALLATARQRPGQGILQASAASFLKRHLLTLQPQHSGLSLSSTKMASLE